MIAGASRSVSALLVALVTSTSSSSSRLSSSSSSSSGSGCASASVAVLSHSRHTNAELSLSTVHLLLGAALQQLPHGLRELVQREGFSQQGQAGDQMRGVIIEAQEARRNQNADARM